MKKRVLSMLLVMLMLISTIPFTYVTAIDIPGTTGDGSAENPFVVDNYGELKEALELESSETIYVTLSQSSATTESADATIVCVGDKVLTIEGENSFLSNNDKACASFIEVEGSLTVKGTGKLTFYSALKNAISAVISLKDNEDARLSIQSAVTLVGTAKSETESRGSAVAAIYANKGALLIADGEYIGGAGSNNPFIYIGALTLAGDVHAYISGGSFHGKWLGTGSYSGLDYDYPLAYGLSVDRNTNTDKIYITGGTFKGIDYYYNLSRMVPTGYGLYNDYKKKYVSRTGFDNGMNTIYEEGFGVSINLPVTVLKIAAPELESWDPFYLDGKSSMEISLLRNKPYDITISHKPLSSELTERGFWVRRTYKITDSENNTVDSYWTDVTNQTISSPHTFTESGEYKLSVCFEMMWDYNVVSTRYTTIYMTVSDTESISNAKFSFDPPVAGANPGGVAVVGGEVDYDFIGGWYEYKGANDNGSPIVGKQLAASDTFEAGKEYMAAVRISLSETLSFGTDFAAYINGRKASVMGELNTESRGAVLYVVYKAFEKSSYVDFYVKAPVEGETIEVTDVAASISVPTVEGYELEWIDEYGEAVSGEFIGGRNYYLKIIAVSYKDTPLLMAEKVEFRVNGEAPDRVSAGRYSPSRQAYAITKKFYCVDEYEFFFTEDSYPEAGGTMTVDIERIAEQSDELMSAYFEDDYSVQWYRDGKALEGATDLSLSFQQKDMLYSYYCELTIGDTVLTSYEFVCENHIHKYDDEYECDDEEHWHGCTDEDCPDYEDSIVGGVHTFVEGSGCTVCGYGASVGILGDVNNDEVINQYDYILVKRHYFGTRILTDDEMTRSDVNGDGVINQYDYILIKRHYFGTFVIGG